MAGVNPRLSVIGLYNWDDTIFDNMQLPVGLDHDLTVKNIMMELAELQVIYPRPEFMKQAIELWSQTKIQQWQKIYNAMATSYNPLWNKDAHYLETETRDLTAEGESENINRVSAFNSEDFENAAKANTTGKSTDTGTVTRERQEYGNIGVTTSQQMLREEVDLWNDLNMVNIIVNDFKNRFCIMVY